MPQLSLYIDSETLLKIETAAKINNTSISKWVTEKLKESLSSHWPDNYKSLFGSIDDETFDVVARQDGSNDIKREKI